MDSFLYDNDFRLERVKTENKITGFSILKKKLCLDNNIRNKSKTSANQIKSIK